MSLYSNAWQQVQYVFNMDVVFRAFGGTLQNHMTSERIM
ncbi:hypothetical protein AvCA_27740 [Azotobacter vinelandii CA]|uniref:Uncharacterized protein n=2 Tax=Azotobacter vinelandii TaxID=354 RepID=C1DKU4_AZOVD|nr:hypothetical protein Avin_27740 [Azotobacter vinelandii DJ]AGK14852.1 hypothetical protein AvCA_27740 [Azotobacter vinelandii CA]AGK20867.1 hypothetical protein AvCA6_27740 [Azotobacter vinelandii CA6]